MPRTVDHIDRQIVELLLHDGRMPSAEIARRIGSVTDRTVRNRIDRLLSEGIIQVSAIVKPIPLGYPVSADVFIRVEAGRVREVADKLAALDCVSYVACSIGEQDISIQVNVRSNEELYEFATEVIGHIPGVVSTNTVLVPLLLKSLSEWGIPESACAKPAGVTKKAGDGSLPDPGRLPELQR